MKYGGLGNFHSDQKWLKGLGHREPLWIVSARDPESTLGPASQFQANHSVSMYEHPQNYSFIPKDMANNTYKTSASYYLFRKSY